MALLIRTSKIVTSLFIFLAVSFGTVASASAADGPRFQGAVPTVGLTAADYGANCHWNGAVVANVLGFVNTAPKYHVCFTSAEANEIKFIQKLNHLKPTGKVGPKVWQLLMNSADHQSVDFWINHGYQIVGAPVVTSSKTIFHGIVAKVLCYPTFDHVRAGQEVMYMSVEKSFPCVNGVATVALTSKDLLDQHGKLVIFIQGFAKFSNISSDHEATHLTVLSTVVR